VFSSNILELIQWTFFSPEAGAAALAISWQASEHSSALFSHKSGRFNVW
jgi:hypothetical protein